MRNINRRQVLLCLGLFAFSALPFSTVQAQEKPLEKQVQKDNPKPQLPVYPKDAVTNGSVTVSGQSVPYQAVAGVLPLTDKDDEEKVTAQIFYVAYFKSDVKDKSTRPITFLYNGGPGSSTLWLHMGSLGPKRVVAEGDQHLPAAPYQLLNNEYSLLDTSDLVFIDMPGTGFGRVLKGQEANYYGVDQDGTAFASFIEKFITKYNRWNSPKFIFGESYGTLRSALVANNLQSQHNIDLNGVILLSQILSYSNSVDGPARDPGNNKPYELALPTYAATAWYHKKLPSQPADLKVFLTEVEHFALNDYARALDQGNQLDENSLNRVATQLHNYTGLSVDYIKKANLRIDGGAFRQQLQLDQNLTTGRLDTRFSGPIQDPLAQRASGDPQSDAISSAYVSLLNDYMRNTLKYGDTMEYRVSVYGRMKWDRTHRGSGTVNVIPDLATAMKRNPNLKVQLHAGYYDLATPYFEGIYELNHLPIPKNLQSNISYVFYESGHMVYLHLPSLKLLHDQTRDFILKNSGGKQK